MIAFMLAGKEYFSEYRFWHQAVPQKARLFGVRPITFLTLSKGQSGWLAMPGRSWRKVRR